MKTGVLNIRNTGDNFRAAVLDRRHIVATKISHPRDRRGCSPERRDKSREIDAARRPTLAAVARARIDGLRGDERSRLGVGGDGNT